MLFEPTASEAIDKVAVPDVRVPVPMIVEPFLKVIVPVAVELLTVAVKFTDWPKSEGFTEDVKIVVVGVGVAYVNSVFAKLVPPAVVTKTLLLAPAVPAGVVAVMVVELTKLTLVAATPLMVTTLGPATKLVPMMVMLVLPAVEPVVGEILLTVGAA